jgi:hypothetical protein
MFAFPRRRWSSVRPLLAGLLIACSLGMLASSASAASPALRKAAKAERKADHRLVKSAKALKRCQQRRPGTCAGRRHAVQRNGTRLARKQRRLARLGGKTRRARAAATVAAPKISVDGDRIKWTRVKSISTYVLVRRVPGLPDEFSLVTGTSVTPPAVPGETVRYSVRAAVTGSAWSPEVAIAYAAVPIVDPAPAPAPTPEPVDLTAAPSLEVSGTTLTWSRVGTVDTYVFVKKVPGEADKYSSVSGTSITPAPVPGKTVRYSVRTAVDGSVWAPEVSITYPESTPAPAPEPAPAPAPVAGDFQMGVVAGSAHTYELSFLKALGAKTARLEFGIGTSASSMASTIDAYAKAGIRPLLLAGFPGRIPSAAEARNLASWAAAYGPGGTFWQGKSYPANTAVTHIEFGNETSYSYQFADYSLGTYSARAQSYALVAKEAAIAIRAANTQVGLLAIGDNAVNQTAWVVNMFKAVPSLGDLVAGWTIHPYGPNWAARMDSTVNSTRTAGSRDLPMWVTEWGLSTDNGRCLDDNYGFDKCMTYGEAATTLHDVLGGMQARYGSRLGAFFLYQAHDQSSTGSSTGRERYFGSLQDNGSAKGAYTTEVKADLAAH